MRALVNTRLIDTVLQVGAPVHRLFLLSVLHSMVRHPNSKNLWGLFCDGTFLSV